MASLESLAECVINGEREKVQAITKSLVDEGKDPLEIINQGLIAGMSVVGARFKTKKSLFRSINVCENYAIRYGSQTSDC